MHSSCLRWICSIFVLSVFSFYSHISFAQNLDAADLGSSNEFIYKLSNQKVYSMRINVSSGGDATLTQLTSQATSGTYAASDVINFSLYYNDVNDFSSATILDASATSTGAGEILTFNSFSQTFPDDGVDRYLFIAANVRPTAVSGRTFGFSFFSAPNFSWTTAVNVSASLGPSGKKTIQPDDFVTTWNTTNSGIGNDRIFLNMFGAGLSYTVSYQDVNNASNFATFAPRNTPSTFIFPSSGTYQIIITGTYSQIINGGNLDAPKLLSVDHWGTRAWSSMDGAFSQCSNLHVKATDAPNLTVATSLHQMFQSASSMNEDLSGWDVSHITDMSEVFSNASSFNQDISSWDVSNVTNMMGTFTFATSFNQDINGWDVSNVTNMQSVFRGTDVFNQSLSNWDVSNVTNFNSMFSRTAAFNQPLNTWDMSSADQLYNMFDEAAVFNGDISNWNVSNATNMAYMFTNTSAFNGNIGSWNVGNVTYAAGMFNNATAFNQNINNWNITGLNDLTNMFAGATAFNQPLNSWDVSNVLTLSGTFDHATSFNQDITGWNTGNAEDMSYMFQGANSFNQNIDGWDVSKVNNMNYMFSDNIAFDQNLGSWNVGLVTSANHMFDYSGLSVANYDNILIGWAALSTLQNYVTLGAAGKKYCLGETAKADLFTRFWDVIDAGKLCSSNPVITLFSPVSGLPGTTVTILGLNFNTNASDNAVYFGAVRANVVSATSTQLVVEVPAGATSVAPIVVQDLTNGLQANSLVTVSGNHARQFTVTYAIPKALKYKLKTQPIMPGAQVNAVAVADFNNDGNPDFATANAAANSVSIVLGSGSGGFTMMPSIAIASDPWSITTGDFNNDGNLDFLTSSPVNGCMMYLVLGNGNGTFGTPTAISGGGCTITAVAADFNNDGNLDVIAGNNSSNSSRILLGDGTGNLTITATPIPSITQTHSIAVSDYNGDGIADLAIEDLTNMYIRLGVGDGTFTIGSTLTPGDTPYSIATGDFNNDGIQDLAEANNISNDVYTFLGNGSGGFSFSTFITLPSGAQPRSVTVGDFNGDGNVDLAIANTSTSSISIALGDGSGAFNTPVTFNLDATSIFPNALASADFDKDGKADLVTGNSTDASIFLMFTPPVITSLSPTHGYPGTTLTINGDNFNPGGPNDIYFGAVKITANANALGTSITVNVPAGATSVTPIVVRNNANNLQASSLASTTPYFTSSLPVSNLSPANYIKTSYGASNPVSIAAADFDNDGYVDLAVPDTGFKNISLYRNDGSGAFTNPWATLIPSVNIFNLKAADINGDGNADLIGASTTNTQLTIFLGNGNGTFTHLSDINGVSGNGAGLSIADVDNDGAPELITSYGGDKLAVLKGDGAGNFATAIGSPYIIAGASVPGTVVTADFNNDTYVDIAVTNSNVSNIYILLNNQDGTFAAPVSVSTGASPFQIVAGRFDSDANIDLAVLTYGSSNMTILQGDGSGGFSPFAGSPVAIGGTPLGLYGGDFDGDGITDLIVGGNDQNNIGFFKGNGSGGFATFSSFPYPMGTTNVYGVITADFNNDGKADIAAAGTNGTLNVLLYHSEAFITRWSTTDNKIIIPHGTGSFNYDITWRNLTNTGIGDGTTTVVDGPNTTFTISGLNNTDIYEVEITGAFPHFKSMDIFSPTAEPLKLRSIENWGNIAWQSMEAAFAGCINLVYNATDKPNLTNVTDMSYMFYDCQQFNGNVDNWDVSNVTNMSYLFFQNQVFNQDLNSWDVSNVTDMSSMFQRNSIFNGNISGWDVGNVTTTTAMFDGCALFDRDISGWDVSNMVNIQSMFSGCQTFNQNLNSWNVSNVTNMSFAFTTTPAFNSPLNNWDVSNVTNMRNLFDGSGFNNPIGNWDVSNVTNMAGMLAQGPFNQNISSWNVSNVTDMSSMFFNNAAFNRSLSSWDVGGVTDINRMFLGASSFNQNLSAWDVTSITNMANLFDGSGLSNANYDNILISWAAQSVQNNVTLGALGKKYCAGESARASLIAAHSWTIIDAGPCAPTIVSFTPATGMTGTTVIITGTKFTGATIVQFGGTNATSFTVDSPTQITAVVGAGSSGSVAVTAPNGTVTRAGFTFIGVPSITSFTPTSAGAGGTVTITGNNFDGTTSVTFGGTAASSFTVVSTTMITATVGSGTSGDIEVINPAGSDTRSGFTFVPAPTITSFTPTTAAGGSTVTITGTNFSGATSVTFGGTNAASFTVISPTSIETVVAGGATGTIAVTTAGGTATSTGTFTFIPAPTIASFTPTTSTTGTTVIITGTDFTGATSVTFGGTAASSFTIVSATEITAVVANGTSGNVEVVTPGGTATLGGFTFIGTPIITSFTPTTAATGATVTITGSNFDGATSVTFGGTSATSFAVVSSTTITAVVGNGTSGNVAVTTPGGTASLAGFTFVNATAPVVVVKDGDNNSGSPVPSQPNQAVDLGQTFVGKDITKAFTIENTGTADLQITSVTIDNANFEITEKPTVIAPNSFGRLAVRLRAEQIGNYSARIAIQYQSGSFEFNVTGEVKDPAITVYNAVTPNGDGNHDYLKIVNIGLYPGNTVTIINRLGEPVFKMSDYDNDNPAKRFVGEANTGSSGVLTDGTYYYIIDIGTKDNHTGFLLLQK